MIAIIRIAGQVHLKEETKESLARLNLKRKYSATIVQDTSENRKLLQKIRNHISYGKINTETLAKLLSTRAQSLKNGTKVDTKKVLSEIEKKSLKDLGLKPFFRLHPPRRGIDSKKHAGEKGNGVLGENKKINELIERML